MIVRHEFKGCKTVKEKTTVLKGSNVEDYSKSSQNLSGSDICSSSDI